MMRDVSLSDPFDIPVQFFGNQSPPGFTGMRFVFSGRKRLEGDEGGQVYIHWYHTSVLKSLYRSTRSGRLVDNNTFGLGFLLCSRPIDAVQAPPFELFKT